MKGIHIQFDNLVNFLQKNIKNKETIENRESFDIIYEKVTSETLKFVSIIFDEIIDDYSIKSSYDKLLKQLKSFLTFKPLIGDDQEDDGFNREFDQLQQFMNSRKPVEQIDNSQRGDIYKFLFQAETKQKDIAEFMGNMNKLNLKGSKQFVLSTKKIKYTMKNIAPQLQQAETQTNMTMSLFQKLDSKFPKLFFVPDYPTSNLQGSNFQNMQHNNQDLSSLSYQKDLQALINQLVKQKLEQKTESDKISQENKQSQASQQEKKMQEKVKPKLNQQKRNSQVNTRRNSNAGGSTSKSKLGSTSKKPALLVSQVESSSSKKHNDYQATGGKNTNSSNIYEQNTPTKDLNSIQSAIKSNLYKITQQKMQDEQNKTLRQTSKYLPSFQTISKLMAGINEEDKKALYEAIQTSIAQNIQDHKVQTENKQVNTVDSQTLSQKDSTRNRNRNADLRKDNTNVNKQTNKSTKNKHKSSFSITSENSAPSNPTDSQFNVKKSDFSEAEQRQKNQKCLNNQHQKFVKFKPLQQVKDKSLIGQQLSTQGLQNSKTYNFSLRQNPGSNLNSIQSDVNKPSQLILPPITKQKNISVVQNRQQKIEMGDFKKVRDTNFMKSLHNSKSNNKQNYSLDMYKAKQNTFHKSKPSQLINLPSKSRNNNQNAIVSLHEDIGQLGNNQYFKKLSKKNIHHENLNLNESSENKSFDQDYPKTGKKDRVEDVSQEEERIVRQLEKISNQNSVKSNLKNIHMYIKFIESVHHRSCGKKCIHLDRFYDFLHKKNLSNRRELLLHKADMNVSLNL